MRSQEARSGWRTSKAGSGHHADRSSGMISSHPSPRHRHSPQAGLGHRDTAGVGTTSVLLTIVLRRAGRRGHVPLSGGFGRR